jgi:hypothetical protein
VQPTRRQALAAGAAVLVTGCTTSVPPRPRVRTTDDAQVVLDVDGTKRPVLYGEVVSAHVQVEFSHPGEGS